MPIYNSEVCALKSCSVEVCLDAVQRSLVVPDTVLMPSPPFPDAQGSHQSDEGELYAPLPPPCPCPGAQGEKRCARQPRGSLLALRLHFNIDYNRFPPWIRR